MVGMREYKCPSEQAVRLFLSGKRFFPIRPRPARVAAFQHQFQLRATRQNNANSRTPPRPIQTSQQARQGVCFSAPAHLTYVHCFRPKPTAPQPLSHCQHGWTSSKLQHPHRRLLSTNIHQAPRQRKMNHQEYKTVSLGEDPEDARSSTEVDDDESNSHDGAGWRGRLNRKGRKGPASKRVCVSILEVLQYLREITFQFTVLLLLVLIIRKQDETPSVQLQVGSDHKSRGPYRQSPHCPSRH